MSNKAFLMNYVRNKVVEDPGWWGDNNLIYRIRCPICDHRFLSHYGKHQHYMNHVREGIVRKVSHPIYPIRLPKGFFLVEV